MTKLNNLLRTTLAVLFMAVVIPIFVPFILVAYWREIGRKILRRPVI